MPQLPHPEILDRESYEEIIAKHYPLITTLVDEVANYGTTLMATAFEHCDKKLEDAVILAVMFKHSVTMLDGISVLAKKCAVTASYAPLRSLFESTVYLKWTLKENTELRARAFYYWDIRNQLSWTRSVMKGTEENRRLLADFKDSPIRPPNIDVKLLRESISILEAKLKADEFREVNRRYESRKRQGQRLRDWYNLDGMENLRDMARSVEWLALYRVFYPYFSKAIHGGPIDRHMSFRGRELLFEPIRNPVDWDQVIRNALTMSFECYRCIIKRYCPSEAESFRKIYISDWQTRFNRIGSVKSNKGTYEFTFPVSGSDKPQ